MESVMARCWGWNPKEVWTRAILSSMRATGSVLIVSGVLELLAGSLYFIYCMLFESWSHSYLSPAHQTRETAAKILIPTLLVGGTLSLVIGMVKSAGAKAQNGG